MRKRQLAAGIGAAVLVLACGVALASKAGPSPEDRELARPFLAWMGAVFAVPAASDLDVSLRESMSALAREHLVRLGALVPEWIAEERARSGSGVTRIDLDRQTRNRLINEIALWRLDSPGPAYDAVWLKAILKPGVCNMPERDSYLGRLMTWLQAVPPADRATALAGERELLARWGRPRADLPPRPVRSLADDEDAAISRLQTGDMVPDIAMAPVVAAAVFAAQREPMHEDTRCALHQWGLARALGRGDSPAASLADWRHAMLLTAEAWSDRQAASAAEAQPALDYPPIARRSAVHGNVVVRVVTDAQGRFASGAIAARTLIVPGIVDGRAVAFETLFDEASLAQAAARFKPVPPTGKPAAAAPMIQINWTLQ